MAVFIGRCDALRAKDLDEFDDTSRDISNRTFRKLIGSEEYLEFEEGLGYGDCLRLAKDWHVSYARGLWKGQPAVCCFWSAYHHIWVLDGAKRTKKEINQRLEYLRQQLNDECISYGELAELQGLAKHIKPDDVQLLEAAGIHEHVHSGEPSHDN